MFERYTEETRAILARARLESAMHGGVQITPADLMLAWVLESGTQPSSLVDQAFAQAQKRWIEGHVNPEAALPLSRESKLVLLTIDKATTNDHAVTMMTFLSGLLT